MFDFVATRSYFNGRQLLLAVSVTVLLLIAACNNRGSVSSSAGPKTFASPTDAGKALAEAATSQNRDELQQIFGPESTDVISSGDTVEDKTALNGFAQAYQTLSRWRKLGDGSELLLVGADNHAFPIPLKKNNTGQWYFDTASGRQEILSRRIGNNEISTIGTCAALAEGQAYYFSQAHAGVKQFAQKFISDPGQENGLYWPEVSGQLKSPLGPLAAYATSEGYKVDPKHHQPFDGYYFVMLDKQGPNANGGARSYIVDGHMTGGFAIVAFPAKYGDSGIMTFLLNQDSPLLQKDLGKTTDQIAAAMTEFNPDKSWTVVE